MEAEAVGRDRATPPGTTRPDRAGPLPQALPTGSLTEHEAKSLLAAYGIRVTREVHARDADAAVAAARDIGWPVVLKGVSRAIVHKSDLGLVHLALRDEAALRAAFAATEAAVAQHAPGSFEGVLVQEMGQGEVEIFLGARHDPAFGPMVLAGIGGVLVEALGDVQTAPAPIAPEDARALFERLRLRALLHGLRGKPPADLDAAVEALVRLSWLAADLGPRLVELDVNPMILRRAGEGGIAVDGRATLA